MQVHKDITNLPAFKNAVITIGTFDGVHTGHQQIIAQLKEEAAKVNGETVIITFHPHPRIVVKHNASAVQLLNSLDEKIALLEAQGVNHLVVVPFNEAFSNLSANDYVHDFLFARFHPHTVIIGYDHHFGKNRQGDYHLMESIGKELGFTVKEIPEQVLNEVAISSTRIREAIAGKDIITANDCLGYPYFFEGRVIEGNRLGRTIGYPTANLKIENESKLIPGNGVYAVTVTIIHQITHRKSEEYKGMMNIGVRPTVNGSHKTIEVNIFDFNEDIYGHVLQVSVHHYLRGEQKFNGLDALKEQLAKDREQSAQLLS
ncbi:riboflavin kinase / FMN adenylyltransferase [Filimonas lacunae]|uniref:Riboflavin biosynthesis protein n=1 Tax=Filimonas lacunae TaxID=477680 RepID=A0A173ME15_9BACT|nr:bifunctional riboflavin kinase/FAD synthetase [Filimonas lacunae]BAV05678.1 riboflavin biosynthesis protein RibF [Filimonas lacunae]SIT28932.1 riboflavin kinase / FMN adenylyltransferase [Filimonas lacunae]